MKLFVGLDVSSFYIKVYFLNGEGDQLNAFIKRTDTSVNYIKELN